MRRKSLSIAWFAGLSLIAFALSVSFAVGKKKEPAPGGMESQKRAVHALSRLTFGARPGDVDRVTTMGVDQWIDLQLHPDRIDDSALDARLEVLPTLRMSPREMVENFPPQRVIKAVADGKESIPSDSLKRAVYEAQLERYYQQQERKQEAANSDAAANSAGKPAMSDEEMTRRAEEHFYADINAEKLLDMPADQRFKAVLKLSPQDQFALASSLKGNKRDQFFAGLAPQQREICLALNNPQQVVSEELMQGKLLHAIYGERQLQEVMTDFWFNHFNVFIGKGADRYMLTSYERAVIRPRALGKFEDLLVATAQSPAMLFYLDNWLSIGPNSDVALGVPKRPVYPRRYPMRLPPPRPQRPKPNRGGLNENYGRELLELHTLGVNGGYTQHDVTEVARVFTGWTLKDPKDGGEFTFDERKHEPGTKVVLGHRIKPNGEKEGREVLHMLARNPATAKFICGKLAVRFVSDNPPPELVDRMAQTFLKKDGDIREVLKTMLRSPEFWSPDAYRAKIKTPLEFVVSAVRASDADVSDAMPLVRQLQNMGMPLYGAQPPTGYSSKSDAWVNSSALLGRMNFAIALTGRKLKGVQVATAQELNANAPPPDAEQALAILEGRLLESDVSKQTHETILARLQDPNVGQRKPDDPQRPPDVGLIAGLLLGSPEFQRR